MEAGGEKMRKIYSREIVEIGKSVTESLEDGFLILFNDTAPSEMREYCVIHKGNGLREDIDLNTLLILEHAIYYVSAIGELVNKNLRKLGHITLKFDGAKKAENPGTLHFQKRKVLNLKVGNKLNFYTVNNEK